METAQSCLLLYLIIHHFTIYFKLLQTTQVKFRNLSDLSVLSLLYTGRYRIACSPVIYHSDFRSLFAILTTEPIPQSSGLFQDFEMRIFSPSNLSFSSSNTYLPILYFICIIHSSHGLRSIFESILGQ